MKLLQIWKDGKADLGIQTEQGIIDVQAEAAGGYPPPPT